MIEPKSSRTLVLVCQSTFCQMLVRMLRSEGVMDYQHAKLIDVGASSVGAQASAAAEVFMIAADANRAERLISFLSACPFRAKMGVCPTRLTRSCHNPRPFIDLRELSAFAQQFSV